MAILMMLFGNRTSRWKSYNEIFLFSLLTYANAFHTYAPNSKANQASQICNYFHIPHPHSPAEINDRTHHNWVKRHSNPSI